MITPLAYFTLFVVGIWAYQNNPTFHERTDTVVLRLENYVRQLSGQNTTSKQETSQSQTSTIDESGGGGRWVKNSTTIYIAIQNQTLKNALEDAISQWNNTGAFTFHITNDKDKATVIASTMDDSSNQAAGLTQMSLDETTGHFVSGKLYLNRAYLLNPTYGYSYQRIVNTAEHELGHVIGLDHDSATSVMQPAGSNYTIQPIDIQNVQKLYSQDTASNKASSTVASN
ncbi:MAG: M57 family metalloprotease [Limosilactobacillus gorillae]|uniref:M57 family metalloprotease n=1 Tax=Limosilactobacillus gorillae TaxID=1450649 RepID=UPI000B096DC5|nr:matrixin family metalloprotease [Limosilactobacillus gorillae]MDO4856284.1 M57 family metalloprotease [Limosilactobacillus gorillae]